MQATIESGRRPSRCDHLLSRLDADDGLEIAHHLRVGMRSRDGADAVERIFHVRHPVAQRLVERILESARTRMHRDHLRAQKLHPEYVGLLPLDIDLAHVHDAFESEPRAGRGGGDPVLAGACLGNDAGPAHASGEQDLAQHIVDLVGAGVIELVALEIDFGAAEVAGQALGEIKRARAAYVVLQEIVELLLEGRDPASPARRTARARG